VRERARLVSWADGRHSRVAKAVGAPAYHVAPARSVAYYTYWAGVPLARRRDVRARARMIGAWPTNDGLVMTYVAAPADEFGAFRADPEGSLLRSLDLAGDLGERVRAGERAERVFGTADTAGRFHVPSGPGWALVGDAGLRMDPITGQGSPTRSATPSGWRRRSPASARFADYRARRDEAGAPDVRDDRRPRDVLAAGCRAAAAVPGARGPAGGHRPLPGRRSRALPLREFFGPRNLLRLLGPRGMLKAGRARRKMAA
jgi:hypothetical protein